MTRNQLYKIRILVFEVERILKGAEVETNLFCFKSRKDRCIRVHTGDEVREQGLTDQ